MKKRKKAKKKQFSTEIQRRPAVIVLALVILAIGAISAVSKQLVAGKQTAANSASSSGSNMKKLANAKLAVQDVQVDNQTEKVKPLNAQDAEQLAQGLKKMLNKSADGLTEVQQPDGTVDMNLEGRFRHVTVARENEDGTVTQSCVDNPRAAARALGVNPKLVDDTPTLPAARPKN